MPRAAGAWSPPGRARSIPRPTTAPSPRSGTGPSIRAHALMTEAVHAHGALAAVDLWHGGVAAVNRTSQLAPSRPLASGVPWMATHVGFMSAARPKVMDAGDIRDLIRRHAEAAVQADRAGFDGATLTVAQIFTGKRREIAAQSLVIVGHRAGGSALSDALRDLDTGLRSLALTGDANAPGPSPGSVPADRRPQPDLPRQSRRRGALSDVAGGVRHGEASRDVQPDGGPDGRKPMVPRICFAPFVAIHGSDLQPVILADGHPDPVEFAIA